MLWLQVPKNFNATENAFWLAHLVPLSAVILSEVHSMCFDTCYIFSRLWWAPGLEKMREQYLASGPWHTTQCRHCPGLDPGVRVFAGDDVSEWHCRTMTCRRMNAQPLILSICPSLFQSRSPGTPFSWCGQMVPAPRSLHSLHLLITLQR